MTSSSLFLIVKTTRVMCEKSINILQKTANLSIDESSHQFPVHFLLDVYGLSRHHYMKRGKVQLFERTILYVLLQFPSLFHKSGSFFQNEYWDLAN